MTDLATPTVRRFEGLPAAPKGSPEAARRKNPKFEHWPAPQPRLTPADVVRLSPVRPARTHDSIVALDMFSGCGGSSQGIEAAGIDVWFAANHWEYAVQLHERNHPRAEHFIADLVATDATDYFHPEHLPRADVLWASPSCFPAGTLILTKRGLLPIEEVHVGDEAWTHMQRWRPVVDTMARVSDTVIVSGNGNRRIEVTPNHGFWARSRITETTDRQPDPLFPHACDNCGDPTQRSARGPGLAKRYCGKACGQRYRDRRDGHDLTDPKRVEAGALLDEWWATPTAICDVELPAMHERVDWWTLGRWIGDGWCSGSDIVICCGAHEADALAVRLPEWKREMTRTGAKFTVYDRSFALWLTEHFGKGAAGKRIPTWALALPAFDQQIILDGYTSADGHLNVDGAMFVSSVSKELAHGIRLLAANVGHNASVSYQASRGPGLIEGRTVYQRPSWTVRWSTTRRKAPKSRRIDGRMWAKVDSVTVGRRGVDVYNITVDEDHTYVADGIVVYNCTNNSKANAKRAYQRNLSLFDSLDGDEEWEDQVTVSERSRATAVSVLQYARKHRPKLIVVENVVEFAQWGVQVGNSRRGDGSTFQWWLKEFGLLDYDHEVLYLNSQFFPPCPQSRDRMYVCMWQRSLRRPDLAHRPEAWCAKCDTVVESQQSFKPRTRAWPTAKWGKYGDQYIYTCPACSTRVHPLAMPALTAIDWSNLGTRIGDRDRPLAEQTMARIERGVERFGEWPPFLMPAKSWRGHPSRPVTDPMVTQTGQQEASLVTSFQFVGAGNTFEHPGSNCRTRGMDQPLPTQHGTPAHGMVTAPPQSFIVANRTNAAPRGVDEPLPTVTTAESRHLLVNSPFIVKNHGGADPKYRSSAITEPLGSFSTTAIQQGLVTPPGFIDDYQGPATGLSEPYTTQLGSETHGLVTAPYLFTDRGTGTVDNPRTARLEPVSNPMSTVSAGGNHHFLLAPLFAKQNGGPADTAWHQVTERLNTLLSADTTCLLSPPSGLMPPVDVLDCFYRMLTPLEIQLGMGFYLDFAMWGSARLKVKALGNAVTPPVASWLMDRMAAVLR